MKRRRFHHGWAWSIWLSIRWSQCKVAWHHLRPDWTRKRAWADRDPIDVAWEEDRKALQRVLRTREQWERWGPDVRVKHTPGRTDDEIITNLMADLFPKGVAK